MHPPEHARVEPFLQLVERPVVRRARVLERDDDDSVVGERGVDDLFRLYQHEPLAHLDRQPIAPVLALGDELDDLFDLGLHEAGRRFAEVELAIDRDAAPRAVDCHLETRRVDWLQQVIDGVHLERLDGVLIERRDENDLRQRLGVEHPPRDFEPGQPGHLDVEEHDVRLQLVDRRQRLDAVAGLTDDLDAADLAEEKPELIARQLFIVNQHRPQIHITPSPVREPSIGEYSRSRRCRGRRRSSASRSSSRRRSYGAAR